MVLLIVSVLVATFVVLLFQRARRTRHATLEGNAAQRAAIVARPSEMRPYRRARR